MPLNRHSVFFFNDTATTEIYTLSLHDALPIYAFHAVGIQVDDHLVPHVEPFRMMVHGLRDERDARHVAMNHHPECFNVRSEEHTSELQSPDHLVCRLLLEQTSYILHHTPPHSH